MLLPDYSQSNPTLPGPIRKEVLLALEESIIPDLWQQRAVLGVMRAPFRFAAGISARLLEKKVPEPDATTPDFSIKAHWSRAKLNSTNSPYLGFIYEGAADERTLVTAAQATKFGISKGIYAVRWHAPGVLLIPPGTPHNGGNNPFWADSEPAPATTKILWIRVSAELLIHTYAEDAARQQYNSHSLHINDRSSAALANLFVEELEQAEPHDMAAARAILLALMLRLQKSMQTNPPKIANTARPPLPPPVGPPDAHTSNICRNAAIFILMHLHEPLSVSQIARGAGLSPAHLNRLFRRFYGVPVMRYVRQQRITAAQKILEVGTENIGEVAKLVGFKQTAAFCSVFRRETGFTPNQFRYRARHAELLDASSDHSR